MHSSREFIWNIYIASLELLAVRIQITRKPTSGGLFKRVVSICQYSPAYEIILTSFSTKALKVFHILCQWFRTTTSASDFS